MLPFVPTFHPSSARNSSKKRKRRRMIDLDEEMDTQPPRSPTRDPGTRSAPPPPAQEGEEERIVKMEETTTIPPPKVGPIRQMGPSIKEVPRLLKIFPPDLPEETRARFCEFMDQKNAVLALLDSIADQMEALRLSRTTKTLKKSAPVPSSVLAVIGKETKVSNPLGGGAKAEHREGHSRLLPSRRQDHGKMAKRRKEVRLVVREYGKISEFL